MKALLFKRMTSIVSGYILTWCFMFSKEGYLKYIAKSCSFLLKRFSVAMSC